MSKKQNIHELGIGFMFLLISDIILWTIITALLSTKPNNKLIFRVLSYLQFYFGFSQYVYIIPLVLWQSLKQNRWFVYGIVISSFLILLINIAFLILLVFKSMGYYSF